jgi:Zn-finger domain-containing protein
VNTKNYIELKSLGLCTFSKTEDGQVQCFQKKFDAATGKLISPDVCIVNLEELEKDKKSFLEEIDKFIAEKNERIKQIDQILVDYKAVLL